MIRNQLLTINVFNVSSAWATFAENVHIGTYLLVFFFGFDWCSIRWFFIEFGLCDWWKEHGCWHLLPLGECCAHNFVWRWDTKRTREKRKKNTHQTQKKDLFIRFSWAFAPFRCCLITAVYTKQPAHTVSWYWTAYRQSVREYSH